MDEAKKSAGDLISEGVKLFEAEKYEEALAVFKSAVDLEEKNPTALYDVGITYSRLNNYPEAALWYDKALQAAEKYPLAYYAWGLDYEKQAQFEAAAEKYRKALEQDATYAPACSALARLMAEKFSQLNEAVALVEGAVKKSAEEIGKISDPGEKKQKESNRAELLVRAGHLYRTKGLPQKAAESYDAAIVIDPVNVSVYQEWGAELIKESGKFEEAAEKYRKAVELAGDNIARAETHKKWGDACRMEGRHEEAVKAFEAARRENPDDVDVLIQLGHCLFDTKNYSQAEICYNQFIDQNINRENDWDLATAHCQLGWILYNQNEYDKAMEKFQLAEQKRDAYGWGFMGASRVHQERGEFDQAMVAIQKAVELTAADPKFCIELGYQYEFVGEYEKALAQYRLAAEKSPDLAGPFFRMGYVHNTLKRYDDAIVEYEKAQVRKPESPADFDSLFASHNIADIYYVQGRYAESKKKWKEVYDKYLVAEPVAARQHFADIYQYAGAISWEFFQLYDGQEKAFKCEQHYKRGLQHDPEHIGLLLSLLEYYMECRRLLEYGGAKQNARNKWLAQVVTILETGTDATLVRNSIDVNWRAMQVFQTLIRVLDKKISNAESQRLHGKLRSQYHLNRAKAHLAVERFEDAKKDAEAALACDARNADACSTLGAVCVRLEDYKSAIRNFKSAIENDTDNLSYLSNLAEAYLKSEMLDEARKQYEMVLKISPFHLDSIIGLAETFAALGDGPKDGKRSEDAEELYMQAIEHYTRALTLADSEDASKVLKPREIAAIRYARGYARVMLFESQTNHDERILRDARRDFESIPPMDKNYQKAKRSAKKITEKLRPFSPSNLEQRAGGWVILIALIAFLAGQFMFFWGQPVRVPPGFKLTDAGIESLQAAGIPEDILLEANSLVGQRFDTQKELLETVGAFLGEAMTLDIQKEVAESIEPVPASTDFESVDVGFYALFTFGPLIFFVAGAYLQQISRLKFAGIEIEKSSVDQISTSGSLGVSK